MRKFDSQNLLRKAEQYMAISYSDYGAYLAGPLAVSAALCVLDDLRYLEFSQAWLEVVC